MQLVLDHSAVVAWHPIRIRLVTIVTVPNARIPPSPNGKVV